MVRNMFTHPNFRIYMVIVFIVSLGFFVQSLITYASFDSWAFLDDDWPRSESQSNLAKAEDYLASQKEPLRLAWAHGVLADDFLSKKNTVRAQGHYHHELDLLEDSYGDFTSERILFVLSRLIRLEDGDDTKSDNTQLGAKFEDHKERRIEHLGYEVAIQKQTIKQNHLPNFMLVHLVFLAFVTWMGFHKKYLSKLTPFLTLLIAYYSLPLVVAFMVSYWSPYSTQIKFHSSLYLGLVAVSGLILLFPKFYETSYKKINQKESVLKEIGIGVGFYVAILVLLLTTTSIIWFAGLIDLDEVGIRNMVRRINARSSWLMIVATCLLVPVVEELIFRGVLYKTLIQKVSSLSTILLSAALFTSIHPVGPDWELYFVYGIGFALLRKWRKTITSCIACHITANCVAVFA